MGHASKANWALSMPIVLSLFNLAREGMEGADAERARKFCKFGAAVVIAVTASWRGPEIFKLNLAGICAFLELGRKGIVPNQPMKRGQT